MALDFVLYHSSYIGVALLLSLSLTYMWRANLFSLGHYGFFAIGAYSAVVVSKLFFPVSPGWFVGDPVHRAVGLVALIGSLATAALVAGSAALLIGRLFSSIRGDYFAVATLIFAEIVNRVVSNWSYVGGAIGAEVPYVFLTNSNAEGLMYVTFYAVLAMSLSAAFLVAAMRAEQSIGGLWLDALREDELAAETSGIDIKALQLTVFVICGSVAGVAGALFLHMANFVTPSDFSFVTSIPTIVYVVLGGLRPLRCVLATVLLYILYQVIKAHGLGTFSDGLDRFVSKWPEAIFGTILIFSVIVPASWQRWRGLGAT